MATTKTKRLRPFAADDYYRLKTAGDVRLSPDGSRVAWVQAQADRDSDRVQTAIWVAPADGSAPARAFTGGPRDVSPRWSPDGRYLSFVSTPQEHEPAQLLLAPLDGGAPFAITSMTGSVSQPVWSPDGTRLAFVAVVGMPTPMKERTPVEKAAPRVVRGLAARQDNIGWFEGRRHVFVVDVETRALRQLTDGDWEDDMPSWSPDGAALVFASDRDRRRNDRWMRSDVWMVEAAGGKPRKLTRSRGRASFPQVSPDGTHVAFVGGEHGDEFWDRDAGLFIVGVDGDGTPTPLGTDLDRPFGSAALPVAPYVWLPDGSILALVADRGRFSIAKLGLGKRSKILVEPDEGQIDGFSVSRDGRRIAHPCASTATPSEVYVRRLTGDPVPVGSLNGDLVAEVELAPLERHTITTADGLDVEYFLLLPPRRRGSARVPVHLEIHGGPHGMHPMSLYLPWLQPLAAAGVAVLMPNPRGSTGYGQAFTEGCTRDWGGGDFDDLLACVDDVVERGIGDPERLTVGGYSYGGFMTTWVVGHDHRFKRAVVGAPVVDQTSMIGTTDIAGFSAFELGGLPWDRPDEFGKRSPITYLPEVRTPVLIQHWEGDLRCPIGQSEQLYAGLKMLGKEVELVRYPGGSHIARSPSQAVDRIERILDWITRT